MSERLLETFPQADIKIIPTSGLCSFYAEDGGLLMEMKLTKIMTTRDAKHLLFLWYNRAMKHFDTIVIGGGPAGMMATISVVLWSENSTHRKIENLGKN